MKKAKSWLLISAIVTLILLPSSAQSDDRPKVCLIVDVDIPNAPSEKDIRSAETNLYDLVNQLSQRNAIATLALSRDVSTSRIRLLLAQYSVQGKLEFAVSGNESSDKLSAMTLSKQEDLISKSIASAEEARICGKSQVNVTGFVPPNFDQNTDTYKIMDQLKLGYNTGFQKGLIYEEGHKNDSLPYKVEGHNFYAVPISSANVSGEFLPLYDKKMNMNGVGSAEWQKILASSLDNAISAKEPVVIMLSTSLSGEGEYGKALGEFLDRAISKNALFVTVRDLVSMSGGEIKVPSGECSTCGTDEGLNLSIGELKTPSINSTENATSAANIMEQASS